jgi:hypothetical protein
MVSTPSMGHASHFAIGAESNGGNSTEFDFVSCAFGKQSNLIIPQGIRGSRSHREEKVVAGTYTVGGQVVLEPRPDDLDILLPYILGTNGALTETVGDFYVFVDRVGDMYDYAGCKINTATFRSAPNGTVQLVLDIQGKTEGTNLAAMHANAAANLSVLPPYVHHQGVLTLGNTAYEYDNPELVIDNALLLDRFNNTQTRDALPESDRVITFRCDNPFSSVEAAALYDIATSGLLLNTWVITNGNYSCTFTFTDLKAPANSPEIGGRNQEIPLRLELQAFANTDTAELVVTNDSTG